MKNGETVAAFEREFAAYVGAKYAIALCNGTATLHTALVAVGVTRGAWVAVPPLTMAATTIAVLQMGAAPVFLDVDPATWLIDAASLGSIVAMHSMQAIIGVSLYGLHGSAQGWAPWIDDAAQTLRPHDSKAAFTSYSFQASKILPLGEGGMLVTDHEQLAIRAREFSSLGYRMRADQPRIDPDMLKSPTFDRHHLPLSHNYRMNDLTAAEGLRRIVFSEHTQTSAADYLVYERRLCASFYRQAVAGCEWLAPQHVPGGWSHDYWTFAVACDTPERALALSDAVVKRGGERPFPAWRLTYDEPAFRHLYVPPILGRNAGCPIAADLQPRLLQFQCNNLESAERNSLALRNAIRALT